MTYPEPPSLSTSYTAKEQAVGDGSFPGQELDNDFVALRDAYIELLNFVKGITRSDGKLANGSVGAETLGAGITLGFEPPTEWATATAYAVGQTVFEANVFYICVTSHTSTVFANDLSSGRWDMLVDFTTEAAAAQAARVAAEAAQSAAETARTGAETARSGAESAQTATGADRTAAETARTAAETAASGAATAQSAAETARTGAETARTGAETAATSASNDASTSNTNRVASETARTGAEAAQTAAEAAAVGSDSGNKVPVGTVMWFADTTAPNGWLIADGTAVTLLYPDLRALLIGAGSPFGVDGGGNPLRPNLLGEFIRGWDNGRGIDAGRVFGSSQDDAFQGHEHQISYRSELTGGGGGDNIERDDPTFYVTNGIVSDGVNGTPRIADETRPRNVALLPCIKAFGIVSVEGMADLSQLLTAIASQAEAEAGTDNTKLMTPLRTAEAIAVSTLRRHPDGAKELTGLQFVDFLNIPAGANQIMVLFSDVSLDANASGLIQFGDSGGIEATGYTGTFRAGSASNTMTTTGFMVHLGNAARTATGQWVLHRMTGNLWVGTADHELTGSNFTDLAAKKLLDGELTQLRIQAEGGNFDGGSVAVLYQ